MAWQGIEGHDDVAARFVAAHDRGRIAGSYLFVGPPGVGKAAFALALAKALVCQSPRAGLAACDACASCVQAQAGSHPDIDVGVAARLRLHARGAGVAGRKPRAGRLADERLGERQREGCLAHAGRAHEQVGAGDPAAVMCRHEPCRHVVVSLDALPGHAIRLFQTSSGSRAASAARIRAATSSTPAAASTI